MIALHVRGAQLPLCLGLLAAFAACGSDGTKNTPVPDAGNMDAMGGDAPPSSDAPTLSLYQRLGSESGITTVITDFVVNRVLKDPKINGYFLNSGVNGSKVVNCLVLQVGALTGGPQIYPSAGCRDMKSSHAGLGISMQDFNDLAGHLVAALQAVSVSQTDIDIIVSALVPMADDIVEDKTNNATVYHRVGRKPAIESVIDAFIAKVVADTRINGFFGTTNAARLKTCLVRQVCSIDGPCKYGQEVDGEPGVAAANPCKDMKSSHAGLKNPAGGGAGARGIGKSDFDALVEDLVMVLDGAQVPAPDKMAILGALGPLCNDIVEGGLGCAMTSRLIVGLAGTVVAPSLVTFDAAAPQTVSSPVAIAGLPTGESLRSLTLRPSNGKLYGLGSSNRIYEVNRITGVATAVGTEAFTPAVAGSQVGFDFNPTVDRIRLTTDEEQNLRLHPDTGVVVATDTNLSPAGSVSAVAYTNSVPMPTTTTLYGIDFASDSLVRIGGVDGMPSPNAGAVAVVGALGVDAVAPIGFDIAPGDNIAFAVFQVGAVSKLYQVNLASGAAMEVGSIGSASAVRAIAVLP